MKNGYYWLASLKSLGYVFITLPADTNRRVFDSDMMGILGRTHRRDRRLRGAILSNSWRSTTTVTMLVGSWDLHLADKQNDLNFFSNGFLAETQAFADSSPLPVYA